MREVHRDPEVDLGVHEQRVVDHRRVEEREVPQRLDRGPGDERQVGQREPLLGLEALAPGGAHALDGLEVDLVGDERMRRGRLGPHHVLGGAAAHVGEGDDLIPGTAERRHGDRRCRRRAGHRHRRRRRWRGCGRRRCGRCRGCGRRGCRRCRSGRGAERRDSTTRERVLPGDAPARPGPRHLGLADAVLGQELAHDRREHRRRRSDPLLVGPRGRRRRRRWCRCWCGGCRRWCRCWCRRRRWRRWRRGGGAGAAVAGCGLGGSAVPAAGVPPEADDAVADHGEPDAHLDRLALGHEDLGEDAGRGRGHLGVDLVGRDLEERLVALDRVPDGLHPAGDRALGHRLAELRHHDVSQRAVPFR